MSIHKEEALKKTHAQFLESCLSSFNVDGLEKIAMSNIMGYGTAKDEIIFGIQKAKDLLLLQKDQSKGLEIEYSIKPVFRRINDPVNSATMVDEIQLNLQNAETKHNLNLRITTCLEYIEDQWMVVHWHGSIPQDSTRKDIWHLDEWKQKAEELQSLVDQKTSQLATQYKELEIEAALARIRSSALSMEKPEELSDIGEKIFSEMKNLGFKDLRNTEIVINQKERENIRSYYYSDYGVTGVIDMDCNSHPLILKWFHDLQEQEDAFAEVHILKDQIIEWEEYRLSLGYLPDPKLTEADGVFYYSYATGSGALSISSFNSLRKEQIRILKRFRNVFSLSYKRYEDIRLAEQQTREAQIEASLERIRGRTMAMRSSSELGEVAKVMFDQMQKLGGDLYAFGVVLCDKQENMVEQWHGIGEAGLMSPFYVPIDLDYIHRYRYDQWKAGVELFSVEIPSDYIQEHFGLMFDLPSLQVVKEDLAAKGIELTIPPWEIDYGASFKYGYLLISSLKPFAEDHIFPRFARVFEQAYTRFLDLQKAEEQSRKAQIEAALEITRAQSMMMQHSEELNKTSQVFHEQLSRLGIEAEFSYLWLPDEKNLEHLFWATWREDKDGQIHYRNKQVVYPLDKSEPAIAECYIAWESGQLVHINPVAPDGVKEYFETWTELLEGVEKFQPENYPDGLFYIDAYMKYGCFGIMIENSISKEEELILSRFSNEFERTYTRFLDLKKAEAQAREAEIEAALERVRAQTMAMHNSEDVGKTIGKMFSELTNLGVSENTRFGIGILNHNDENMELWTASKNEEDETVLDIGFLKMSGHALLRSVREAWKKQKDINMYELEGQDMLDYYQVLNDAPDYTLNIDLSRLPERHYHYDFPFNQGIVYAFSDYLLPEELLRIFKKFSALFGQTYRRYLDLKNAEAQAREAQIETALERVRAASMAMHSSEELSNTAHVLYEQFRLLGENPEQLSIGIIKEDENVIEIWLSMEKSQINKMYRASLDEPIVINKLYNAWLGKEKSLLLDISGRDLEQYQAYRNSNPEFEEYNTYRKGLQNAEVRRVIHAEFFQNGALTLSSSQPQKEEVVKILRRFTAVFDLAYTRFLDLQKAEAQAREAQIEAALERVRSRTMGMQKSEELSEVIQVIHDQLVSLGLEIANSGILLDYMENDDFNLWMADSYEKFPVKVHIPFFEHPHFLKYKKAKDHGQVFFCNKMSFEEKNNWFKHIWDNYLTELTEETKQEVFELPGYAISTVLMKNAGLYILNYQGSSYSDKENAILLRFGKVLEQTYTRFLDLQKAEAQAREAQIEVALESIRSRSLAVTKSDEFSEVVAVVFRKLSELNINVDSVLIALSQMGTKDLDVYGCGTSDSGFTILNFALPYFRNPFIDDVFAAQKKSATGYYSKRYSEKEKNQYYDYALEHTELIKLPDYIKERIRKSHQYGLSVAYAKNSIFMLNDMDGNLLTEEDADILKRFSKVFEQAYIRFLDLQKAEAQTREAEIQLALERVRAASMAMYTSDELANVTRIFFEQLIALKMDVQRSWIDIFHEEDGYILTWSTDFEGLFQPSPSIFPTDFEDETMVDFLADYKSPARFIEMEVHGKGVEEWFDYLYKMSSDPIYKMSQVPNDLYQIWAKHKYGTVATTKLVPFAEDEKEVLARFANVFEQAYTRFLDLQTAEAQAREAEVETALERVRSRAIGMHKSNELVEVSNVLYVELFKLGINQFAQCGFVIIDEELKKQHVWGSSISGNKLLEYMILPLEGDKVFDERYEAWKKKTPFYIQSLTGDQLKQHLEFAMPDDKMSDREKRSKLDMPETTHFYFSNFSSGYLQIISPVSLPEELESIFIRFAKVFEQSYSRFLDLQKAEAQAREAQITSSLERVRAASMAMHHSDGLSDVLSILFEQFDVLGINPSHAVLTLIDPKENFIRFRMTGRDGYRLMAEQEVDLNTMNNWVDTAEKWMKSQPNSVNVNEYPPELLPEIWEVYDDLITSLPEHARMKIEDFPDGLFITEGYCKFGYIGFAHSRKPTEEEKEIVVRMASEFGTLYQRFLELQKAEKQAREAQIEAALERVRSRAMAMQNSDELYHVSEELRKQMALLGQTELELCMIHLYEKDDDYFEAWGAIPIPYGDKKYFAGQARYPKKGIKIIEEMLDHYASQELEYTVVNENEKVNEWFEAMQKYSPEAYKAIIRLSEEYPGGMPPRAFWSFADFEGGSMGMVTYSRPDQNSKNLLSRSANVFGLAYTRFLDLQEKESQAKKLREEKERLEETLAELRATQAQLIHSEKMASLGELTAGIAHEIQNPLNFVNNFSEVSSDMVEEATDELGKGDIEETKEILNDLKGNLDKISHHGHRASSIVKSMLDHSRTSSGDKVETDINTLCEEYLRLAYHGMRAKDRNFNAALETHFDESIPKMKVVPQDIGRVLLNLINNAFQALSDMPSHKVMSSLSPKVELATKNLGQKIEITVSDNGPGIPADIKDKIFQPFFTTKPTGEGTGLGLSLSYDIIMAHKGEIQVTSDLPKGTTFIITIPITKTNG